METRTVRTIAAFVVAGLVSTALGATTQHVQVTVRPSLVTTTPVLAASTDDGLEVVQLASTKKKGVAENGSYYGQTSESTGRAKTVHVKGYTRKDGTYVQGHFRSKPKK